MSDSSLIPNNRKAKQPEAVNKEDLSRRRVLKGMATLYNKIIQNDGNQQTNAKAQEFLQIWKEGDTTIDNVLSEHGKLIEEYKDRVTTYIKSGREYLGDLKKVGYKFEKTDQLLSTEEERNQKISDLTENIRAQNLAISHILLDKGVYNHEGNMLADTPRIMEKSIAKIQRNKVKANPNFGNSALTLISTGLTKDQKQERYPVDFLKNQIEFEGIQLSLKADIGLLGDTNGAIQRLNDTTAVQFLDSELGGVQGNTSEERVLSKLALLHDAGQQIKNSGTSSSSLGIQDLVQLKLEECKSGLTIKAMLEEYSGIVTDYKKRVDSYTTGCQEYVGELHNTNKLLPKILGTNGAKTNWDDAEKELNSLGVMSIFLQDESLSTQYRKIINLEEQREVLNLVLSNVLTYDEIYSGLTQDASQNKREFVNTTEALAVVISKIQTDRMEVNPNISSDIKILSSPKKNSGVLPHSFQNDQRIFTDVQAVFKGKENPEKLQKKYGDKYQGTVRQYSELYILNELIGELEDFSKIENDLLAHKPDKESSKSSEVKGGARLSIKGAVQLVKNMVSAIMEMLGLEERRSHDVNRHEPFKKRDNQVDGFKDKPELNEAINIAMKKDSKRISGESVSDLCLPTGHTADITGKKSASHDPNSLLKDPRAEGVKQNKVRIFGR